MEAGALLHLLGLRSRRGRSLKAAPPCQARLDPASGGLFLSTAAQEAGVSNTSQESCPPLTPVPRPTVQGLTSQARLCVCVCVCVCVCARTHAHAHTRI